VEVAEGVSSARRVQNPSALAAVPGLARLVDRFNGCLSLALGGVARGLGCNLDSNECVAGSGGSRSLLWPFPGWEHTRHRLPGSAGWWPLHRSEAQPAKRSEPAVAPWFDISAARTNQKSRLGAAETAGLSPSANWSTLNLASKASISFVSDLDDRSKCNSCC